jgi:hypothetical protein
VSATIGGAIVQHSGTALTAGWTNHIPPTGTAANIRLQIVELDVSGLVPHIIVAQRSGNRGFDITVLASYTLNLGASRSI